MESSKRIRQIESGLPKVLPAILFALLSVAVASGQEKRNIHKEIQGGFLSSGWLKNLEPKELGIGKDKGRYKGALEEAEKLLKGEYDRYYGKKTKLLDKDKEEVRYRLLKNSLISDYEMAKEVRGLLRLDIKDRNGKTTPGPLNFEGKITSLLKEAKNLNSEMEKTSRNVDFTDTKQRLSFWKEVYSANENLVRIKELAGGLVEMKEALDWKPGEGVDVDPKRMLASANKAFNAILNLAKAGDKLKGNPISPKEWQKIISSIRKYRAEFVKNLSIAKDAWAQMSYELDKNNGVFNEELLLLEMNGDDKAIKAILISIKEQSESLKKSVIDWKGVEQKQQETAELAVYTNKFLDGLAGMREGIGKARKKNAAPTKRKRSKNWYRKTVMRPGRMPIWRVPGHQPEDKTMEQTERLHGPSSLPGPGRPHWGQNIDDDLMGLIRSLLDEGFTMADALAAGDVSRYNRHTGTFNSKVVQVTNKLKSTGVSAQLLNQIRTSSQKTVRPISKDAKITPDTKLRTNIQKTRQETMKSFSIPSVVGKAR